MKNKIYNIYRALLRGKSPVVSAIFAGMMVAICLLFVIAPQTTSADFANTTNASFVAKAAAQNDEKVVKTIKVIVTAYSSTPDQTDSTPFITASGKDVADGIAANNLLPFGTKIMIPNLYGDKVFTIEDRMNQKMGNYHVDLWMPSTALARNFGVKIANIEVLED